MKDLFIKLGETLKENGLDYEYDESDGSPSLHIMMENAGPDEDGVVITELCRVPVETDTDVKYFLFNSMIAMNVEFNKIPIVAARLCDVNLETVIGAFGVIPDEDNDGIIYHKYTLCVWENSGEKLINRLYQTFVDVMATIDLKYYDVMMTLAE